MKRLLLFSILLLFSPGIASADTHVSVTEDGDSNVNVRSNSSGTTTKCVNGKCTTTGGESKSTVCINGECTDYEGDVDISENGGKIQININNSNNTKAASNTKIN